MPQAIAAQIPQNPNVTDKDGLRQGTWTILYNADWKVTEVQDSITFYRIISYVNDKPFGVVRNYYPSGQLYVEVGLLRDRPEEIYHGGMLFYREDGTFLMLREFSEDQLIEETYFNLDGTEIETTWGELSRQFIEEFNREAYQLALVIGMEVLVQCELQFGKKHENYGTSLNNLAILYDTTGDYDKAISFSMEAVENCRGSLGVDHSEYGNRLSVLGGLFQEVGKYEKALPVFVEALGNCKRTLGVDHSDYAAHLNNLALLHEDMGDYARSLPLYLEALKNIEKSLGIGHFKYGICLGNLAALYQKMGDYETALPLFMQALKNCENSRGVNHSGYGAVLNNVAALSRTMGDYEMALSQYLGALENTENSLGIDHPTYGKYLNNLGELYLIMGDHEKALWCFLEALSNCENSIGVNHSAYDAVLGNLAWLYQKMGEYEKAWQYFTVALENTKSNLGENHHRYGGRLASLAGFYKKVGEYAKALPLYIEALEITKMSLGENHSNYGLHLDGLAGMYKITGEDDKALACYQEALENAKISLGEEHSEYGISQKKLAVMYEAMGDYEKAFSCFLESSRVMHSNLADVMTFTSENQQTLFISTVDFNFEIIQSFARRHGKAVPEACGLVYNNELGVKGQMLMYSRMQKRAIASLGEQDQILAQELQNLQNRIYRMELDPEALDIGKLNDLKSKAEDLDRQLARSSSAYREANHEKSTSWQDVQEKLQVGEAAIEFIHFHQYDDGWQDSTFYAALLLNKNAAQPLLIALCEGRELKALLKSTSDSDQENISNLYKQRSITRVKDNTTQLAKGTALYNLIWGPLEEHLQGIETVYFTPSGLLNSIALDALPTENGVLGDSKTLHRLSSTRNVVHGAKDPNKSSIAIYSGIEYAYDSTGKEPFDDNYASGLFGPDISEENKGERISWDFLEGAEKEGKAIAAKFGEGQSTLATGKAATEASIKSLSGDSPSILQISSHAFFFPDVVDTTRTDLFSEPVFKRSDDPLMRSGLIMAGANYAWKYGNNPYEDEDGILTAYEISHLDLDNTDLVVLSACETGLGEVRGSEGVFGLQRAFKMAGVDYIIMSLWKVPDDPTRQFMELFYDNWLGGQPIREAFKNTQRTMSEKYDPYEWAAFVLVE